MKFLSKPYVIILVLILTYTQSNSVKASEINLIANSLYPTSYVEDGQIKGLAIEIAHAVLERAGIKSPPTRIYPYKRALYITENSTNSVLVSLARTPSRENTFSWIGKLVVAVRFFVSRENTTAYSVEAARGLKSIGVLKGSSLERQLKDMGFNNLVTLGNEQTSFRMLSKQRIDAWFTSNVLLAGVLLSQGLEKQSNLTIGPTLAETADIYMAASKHLPNNDLSKLRSAFHQLENEGVLIAIRKKYGLERF